MRGLHHAGVHATDTLGFGVGPNTLVFRVYGWQPSRRNSRRLPRLPQGDFKNHMAIIGYYHLYACGELLYVGCQDAKPGMATKLIAVWPLDLSNRNTMWNIVIEATALGAKSEIIQRLKVAWDCTNRDAKRYARRANVRLDERDNVWYATTPSFINFAVSPFGSGSTVFDAIVELAKSLWLTSGIADGVPIQ